jgi:hypothetical protein
MKTMANPTCSVRRVLGRLSHRQAQGETARVTASGSEVDHTFARPGRGRRKPPEEPEAVARGVIRREVVSLLARYGTSYGLFDEWSADYECVLKSDAYRLGEYVGDSVWVSGPLTAVIGGIPVMEVTHLELLKMKWMG